MRILEAMIGQITRMSPRLNALNGVLDAPDRR